MEHRQTKGETSTLLETNSSHLEMDGWNTTFLLGWYIFRCELLVSGRVCGNLHRSEFRGSELLLLRSYILGPGKLQSLESRRNEPHRQAPKVWQG